MKCKTSIVAVFAAVRKDCERDPLARGECGDYSILGWADLMRREIDLVAGLWDPNDTRPARAGLLSALASGVICLTQHGVPEQSAE